MQKRCSTCHIEKDLDAFHKAKQGRFGIGSMCKICARAKKRAKRDANRPTPPTPPPPGFKVCTQCGIEKPFDDFHKRKRGKYGVAVACKICALAYERTPTGKAAKAKYGKSPGGKAGHARSNARRLATPEGRNKATARVAVWRAVKTGKLIRPDVCTFNDSLCSGQIQGHHHKGYERAFWLDVEWLCKAHHELEESRQRFYLTRESGGYDAAQGV